MDVRTVSAMRAYSRMPMPIATQAQDLMRGATSSVSPTDIAAQSNAGATLNSQRRDFSSTMRSAAMAAIDSLQTAEATSLQSLDGKGDVQQLMRAMADAEMTVRTVTAVRDKVVEAYQEIMRMPV